MQCTESNSCLTSLPDMIGCLHDALTWISWIRRAQLYILVWVRPIFPLIKISWAEPWIAVDFWQLMLKSPKRTIQEAPRRPTNHAKSAGKNKAHLAYHPTGKMVHHKFVILTCSAPKRDLCPAKWTLNQFPGPGKIDAPFLSMTLAFSSDTASETKWEMYIQYLSHSEHRSIYQGQRRRLNQIRKSFAHHSYPYLMKTKTGEEECGSLKGQLQEMRTQVPCFACINH